MEIKMEYIVALIGAGGTVLAAILGALIASGFVSQMFKRNVLPLFRTYSDKKHDVHRLMRGATENIYFVVSLGDQLLKKYGEKMQSYLERGVKLKFLIHEESKYLELENYINDCPKSDDKKLIDDRNEVLDILRGLKQKYPKLVEIRESSLFFSASYIGIDIEENLITNERPSSSIIQVMLYQYEVQAKNSPITYFTPKTNRDLFESTAESILKMWNAATKLEMNKKGGEAFSS
ncbi:MAG: hypothetical protein J1E06_09875 [Acutalibacter sp.]|nr:hypothetical protein [Acutalibacter sp.]